MNDDHPILITIHELHSELIQDGTEIVFAWVPGHIGVSGNSAADFAAKDALDGDISDEYIPFSDLKPHLNNDIVEFWQNECDTYPLNRLHKLNPQNIQTSSIMVFQEKRRDCSVLTTHLPLIHVVKR